MKYLILLMVVFLSGCAGYTIEVKRHTDYHEMMQHCERAGMQMSIFEIGDKREISCKKVD